MKLKQIDYQQYRRYYQVIAEMQKRPHTHLYATVAFTFLVISLFAWYAIRPTLSTILYLRREIQDKTVVNEKMEEKIAALIEAQNTIAQIEPSLPLLSEALPPAPDAVGLISQLHSLAGISQASMSSVRATDVSVTGKTASPSGAQNPGVLSELPLSITLTGTFEPLMAFLRGMIDMRRIVAIDTIGFNASTTNSSSETSGPLQMVVKIRSFYIPEGK